MKKSLMGMTIAATMMFAAVTSYAAGSYTPESNSAVLDNAAGKSTVLIYEGNGTTVTADKIVYIDQASRAFQASTKFLLKAKPKDGIYIVKLGSSDGTQTETETFYIGMSDTAGDKPMTLIPGADGYKVKSDGTYDVGYKATLSFGEHYNSLIIKTNDGKYLGCANPLSGVTVTGDTTVDIGIQINGVSGSVDNGVLTSEIAGVWLSPRTITGNAITE